MKEQLSVGELQQRVDSVRLGLLRFGGSPEIKSIAFYAMPPWKTNGEPDIDLLIVTEEEPSEDTIHQLNETLASLAAHTLPIDRWMLTASQLEQRMRRIAGARLSPEELDEICNGSKKPQLPPILRSTSEWEGFGFVPVVGSDYLSQTIHDCYSAPEAGGAIPATALERRRFNS